MLNPQSLKMLIVIKSENGYVDVAFSFPHGVKKLMAGHPTLKRKTDLKN